MNRNNTGISFSVYPSFIIHEGGKQERFPFIKVRKEEKLSWKNQDSFYLLFLMKGAGRISTRDISDIPLHEKQCILIHKAEFLAYTSCELVVWLLSDRLDPADRTFFRTLQPPLITQPYSSQPLIIGTAIENFLQLLVAYQEDGLIEQDTLYDLKQRELLLLFRHYYHPEALAVLFYPLLCRMNGFRERIFEHFQQVRNTGELINRLGMKRTSFERKFRQHFGTSAHQWLLQQKAVAVKRSLQEGKYSLNEIRRMYGFNSATHFVRFCRKQLGAPPSQLRRDPHLPVSASLVSQSRETKE